jgi:hypothetical protein
MIFYDVSMRLLVYAPPPTHTHTHTQTCTHIFCILYMKYMHILHCMIMQKIMSGLVTELLTYKISPSLYRMECDDLKLMCNMVIVPHV